MSRRVLALLTLLSVVTAYAEDSVSTIDGFTQSSFDHDLTRIVEPEAFEAPGLPPLWPRISIPALSTAQVSRLVKGNTLRVDDEVAVYFLTDGNVEAWLNDWRVLADDSRCPRNELPGDSYLRAEGHCKEKVTTWWTGRWDARSNAVCVDLRSDDATEKQCWHLAIVTDRIAFFDETGDMLGRLKVLKRGRVLAQVEQ